MNTIFVILTLAVVTIAVDIQLSGTILGEDSVVTGNSLGIKNLASSTLSSISFTATPSVPQITIYYPGSGTRTTVSNIASGATGYGGFQVLGPSGQYTLEFNVTYKKSNVFYNHIGSLPLSITTGGGGSNGKREISVDENAEVVPQIEASLSERNGNDDISIVPSVGYLAEGSTPIWQYVSVVSKGSALNGVKYTIVPSDSSVAISYPSSGNIIGDIAANEAKSSNFQMSAPVGTYSVDVTVSYQKAGADIQHTETLNLVVSESSEAVANGDNQSTSFARNNMTVIGLAIGGVALIAIVALVVVVVVVRKQRYSNVV